MSEVSKIGATPSASEVKQPAKAPEGQNWSSRLVWGDETKVDQDKGVKIEKTTSENANPAKADLKLVQPTQHKVNKGFYPATSDASPDISGKDGLLTNNGQKIRESSDPAGTVADAVISSKAYGVNAQMANQVRQMLIQANPSVFEKDGKLKENADLGKLDLPTIKLLNSKLDKSDPKRTVIPKGFYPAFKDGNSDINGLTETQLRRNETKEGNGTAGAVQILNALLKTKASDFMASGERRAALLNDLVRKNPSVFDGFGHLKKDADLTKLDVPSLDYMNKAYGKLPYNSSKPATFGNNGFYAVGTGKDAKFYMANGAQVSARVFAAKCPSIYKQVTAR